MVDPTRDLYFPRGSSRTPHSRPRANSDEHTILPHLLAPLPCESQLHSYLATDESPQNISVQFMHSCPGQDATQLDSDILHRHLTFAEGSSTATVVAYPESSQRTTSHPLPPYATGASDFSDYPCDLATLHGDQTFRRGSWPSHSQTGYSSWIQSPPRMLRSPVSEPPESTSDESYQDSDADEATQMSPMMNQFQIQSSRNIELPPHIYRAQTLQPSLMTFQLSETMLQLVDDHENGEMVCGSSDISVIPDDESELANAPSSPTYLAPFSIPSSLQGPGMRLQRERENPIQTSQFRVSKPSSNTIPFPSAHSPTNTRVGDQRPSGSRQQKKSKMHQCPQCNKLFPRPSGLKTHMNIHSGEKPYECVFPGCTKSFAVRSNAKRHLRTHGINPSSQDVISMPRFTVGFEEPMVTQVHDAARQPSRYRWIPHNPSSHEHEWPRQVAIQGASHSAITSQPGMSSATSSSLSACSDDGYDEPASVGAADVRRSEGDYSHRENDGFSGTYPGYRQHPHRG